MKDIQEIKEQILELTKEYYRQSIANQKEFEPGDRINYSGRVYDEKELVNLVDSALEFWLTAGRYTKEFEQRLGDYLGIKHVAVVNSGSSANLLAFMALTSYELGDRRICKGDEVITVAAGFPTTIAPIIQYGAVPVFVDVTIPEYNINITQLEKARSEKTKAVMLAHTLGNPFNVQVVKDFCDKYGLWMVEDNCDALGSEVLYNGQWKKTGTIGDIGTSSFYPPHHITMGEGGAVYTDNPQLFRIVKSLRDWGRDCSCEPGQDNRCGHRYDGQYGQLPKGYDHKYVYSHFGYNLKATDMQAAVGCAQLDKLHSFTDLRITHWNLLNDLLQSVSSELILPKPLENSRPSWFGFAVTVPENSRFTRDELAEYLEFHNIQTRNLFAGNIIKHPCFDEYRDVPGTYRVAGELTVTDRIMNNTFWVGVYPGMSEKKLCYMAEIIIDFVNKHI